MRRVMLLAVLLLAASHTVLAAQVAILAGGGLGTPIGDFSDAAESGWHALAGLRVGVPAIPVAAQADGGYHSFGQATALPSTSMLSGSLSLVVNLPGVGLVPYLLGGVGQYRVSVDAPGADPLTRNGYHGAFGVNIGALGFGGFGEVRVANVSLSGSDWRFVTATLGLRF